MGQREITELERYIKSQYRGRGHLSISIPSFQHEWGRPIYESLDRQRQHLNILLSILKSIPFKWHITYRSHTNPHSGTPQRWIWCATGAPYKSWNQGHSAGHDYIVLEIQDDQLRAIPLYKIPLLTATGSTQHTISLSNPDYLAELQHVISLITSRR